MSRRQTYAHISDKRYNKTKKQGDESEDRFESLMTKRGHEVIRASVYENRNLHIDLFVNGEGVDVKGGKRTDYIWLEIQNVFGGKGWLKGKAKWIAFDLTDLSEYQMYKREDLLKFVTENVTETTESSKDFMKLYTRKKYGGDDIVVRCNQSDINHLLIQSISYATTETES